MCIRRQIYAASKRQTISVKLLSMSISMRYLVWISSLVILSTTIHDACGIINGKPVKRSEFPYSVILVLATSQKNCLVCTGAIISKKHILTAAHCFYCIDTPKQIEVLISDSLVSEIRTIVKIKDFYRHPDYEAPNDNEIKFCVDFLLYCLKRPTTLTPKNDIAVATLVRPLNLGGDIDKVLLPPPGQSSYPELCSFSGWGQSTLNTKTDGDEPSLHWTQLSILKPAACRKLGIYVTTNDILCAEDLTQRSYPYSGDSGGPLVCDNIVYGVYSTRPTVECRPSFFFKVSNYLNFIFDVLSKT